MNLINLATELSNNTYPGRGIVLGLTPDGKKAAIGYFTMGRSVNSRNRIFIDNGDDLKNEAFDPSKLVDPSLIIYAPVRVMGNNTIVTNGDQTDTVYDFIKDGKCFEDALRTRTFEPDPPNFTPRISGMVTVENGEMSYKLSILKSMQNNESSVQRFFFDYAQPISGTGHFIHTYDGDGDPIPTFSGTPKEVAIPDDIDTFTSILWDNLNNDNKVSLFTRYIDIATGEYETRIENKNK
ncbi:MAG: IMP cyclohydrolase [Acutalibacteraceae bacterium]|nr:IMP cyclohydrolase [Clostridia bacterium]MEE1144363.1 IMP cyclohydrolase [Acutalibacteraceae bacterium]